MFKKILFFNVMKILYIDADNISYKLIQEISKHIDFNSIGIKKVYGDWSKKELKNWENIVLNYGLEAIQCFRIAQKQSTDIKLITDLIEDIHNIHNLTHIYLVSSDSDYSHVCQLIKKKEINLTIISQHFSILNNYCDNFIEINTSNSSNKKTILYKIMNSNSIMLFSRFQKSYKRLFPNEKINRDSLIDLVHKYSDCFVVCTIGRKKYIINISDFKDYNEKDFLDDKDLIIENYKNIFQLLSFEDLYNFLFTDSHI